MDVTSLKASDLRSEDIINIVRGMDAAEHESRLRLDADLAKIDRDRRHVQSLCSHGHGVFVKRCNWCGKEVN